MNFVFVSPHFPETYWNWCDRLCERGVNVLGIGDVPQESLTADLKACLTEYCFVSSLEDYDQVFRAMAYLTWRHGRIDWVESNNEYWLPLDARLRDDFNITTGEGTDKTFSWLSKAEMKPLYAAAGVPTARQVKVGTFEDARAFVDAVGGYPVFAKPERGMGSGGARTVLCDEDLGELVVAAVSEPYVLEEFVRASQIVSYDAILDSKSEPLFENMEEFPPSMADVASMGLDLVYYSRPTVDPALSRLGRAASKAFGIKSRFVHMEFFRLDSDTPGLGEKGDYIGLEVNVRPPGGYTPDMMNYAHSVDVYRIWADMVCFDENRQPRGENAYFCVYVGRRDAHAYAHSHQEVLEVWGDKIMMFGRIPDALSDDMGNFMYTARVDSETERESFVDFVCAR